MQKKHTDVSTLLGLVVFFLLFPASFTAVVPRVTVELERTSSGVHVGVCAHALIFIPYYCQRAQGVSHVELKVYDGERVGYNAQLSDSMNQLHRRGHTATNAEIHFRGSDDVASAMIDTNRMADVLVEVQTFIDTKVPETLSMTFFAHSAGLYVGGFLSLLTLLLFVPLMTLAIIRRVLDRPYWPFHVRY